MGVNKDCTASNTAMDFQEDLHIMQDVFKSTICCSQEKEIYNHYSKGFGSEVFAFQLVVRGSDMVSTSITRSFILY